MPKILFANNAETNIAASITAGATTILITPGDGIKFPMPTGGDYFQLTLVKMVGGVAVYEVVSVTARAGDSLTVIRGQEGTTATSFSASDIASERLTALILTQFAQVGADNTFAGNTTFTGSSTLAATTFTGAVTLSADPANALEPATKQYVDQNSGGLSRAEIHAAILSF
jgi:hypothetical protein